ncbi:MAG: D-threitol dehydrogenase [Treponema sp.]|jgi:NAD(P)-dependent dehydrogenase (short-subunit alcohol dehydrogenase family)|nr:D-threitol dehydrogenase [Treponema sp.]
MITYKGVSPDFSLLGKVAIITGGTAGIGYATAELFAKKGVKLVLAATNPATDCIAKKLGTENIGVPGNLCEGNIRKTVLDKTLAAFGKVDILLNIAGISLLEKAESYREEHWDRMMDVNLKASFMMAKLVGAHWIACKQGDGCIVNMASQAGVIALDKHVAYCASKAAIIAMTKVLALEWGKYGIRVNCVSPTVVMTEMGRRVWDNPAGDAFKKEIPAGRFAEVDEIAGVTAFLCSDAAAMITGHNLIVDGGYTIR